MVRSHTDRKRAVVAGPAGSDHRHSVAAADQRVRQVGHHGLDPAIGGRRDIEVRRCDHRHLQRLALASNGPDIDTATHDALLMQGAIGNMKASVPRGRFAIPNGQRV
jgi:hypothetical protein